MTARLRVVEGAPAPVRIPCPLCADDLQLVASFPGITGAAKVPCIVCRPERVGPRLVLLPHPYRRDVPRRAS